MNGKEIKFNNWIELLGKDNCFVCWKKFTEEDKREITLPVSELAKKWKKPDLKAEQLKEYEIFPDQFSLNFPIADIYTNVLVFTGNYCGCC